jgi:hypothetical protein
VEEKKDLQKAQKAIITAQNENQSKPRQRKLVGQLKAAKLTDLIGPSSMNTKVSWAWIIHF